MGNSAGFSEDKEKTKENENGDGGNEPVEFLLPKEVEEFFNKLKLEFNFFYYLHEF